MIDCGTGALFYYPCLLRKTSKCVVKTTAKALTLYSAWATGSTSKPTKKIIVEWQDVYINHNHVHKHLCVFMNTLYSICVSTECQVVKTNLKCTFYSLSSIIFFFIYSSHHCAHASETLALLVCLETSWLYLSDIQLFSLSIHYEMIWFAGCRASSGALWHLWCLQYPGNTWKPITCSPRSSVAVGWLNSTGWSQLLSLEEGQLCFQSNWGRGKRRDAVGHRQFQSCFRTVVLSLVFATHPPLPKCSMVISTMPGNWAFGVLKIKSGS